MARIALEQVAHAYAEHPRSDAEWALKDLDQVWEDGGAYALLGPSGCGKTTLLNVISGLIAPRRGRILFDGREVTGLGTEQRNIAQVFQFPVVYDTMTVFDNLAFPLRNRHIDETRVRSRVAEVAEMLDLAEVLGRRARRLTADAKQKISLGRGLVREDVAAILFDEPLTVIDPGLKWQLRRKLKEVHKRRRLTLIYVTHDQNEALTFADRVAVMNEGRVLQVGTPQALFERPAHRFVGYFIGSPGMNFVPCVVEGDAALVAGARLPLAEEALAAARVATGRIELGVRPEHLRLAVEPAKGAAEVTVRAVEDLGTYRIVTIALGEHVLKAKLAADRPVPAGAAYLSVPPAAARLYAGGRLIG